jgi:spore coat polysaccharide biosynthesis protein SpsF (cytidylyltransferase family)
MLELIVRRLSRSETLTAIVVATSILPDDDPIADLCKSIGVDCVRGELEDVRGRFLATLQPYAPDHFVRVTADCPLVDPIVLDKMVSLHLSRSSDYTSNTLNRTYPKGLDLEVVRFSSFKGLFDLATNDYEKEHVTPQLHDKTRFTVVQLESEPNYSHLRWTVDYLFDLELVRRLALGVTDVRTASFDDLILVSSKA